ncbi:MAG: MerR family transcriptional regulator [Candidatus Sumerlaeia bacterium]
MKSLATAAVPQTAARKKAGKLFYRIQEVSRMTGLKPYVLRYWETEFPELSPAKDHSDQRRYRQADIDVVLAIRKLLYEDRFTIEGARRRLRDEIRAMHHEEAPAPKKAAATKAEAPVRAARPAPVMAPPSSEQSLKRLNQSLASLRREVNDLLAMLKG